MRGKSLDIDFISEFVEECVQNDKLSPKDIASEAKIKIGNIDNEIRRIEGLKAERSRLMDVVTSFDLPDEEEETETVFAAPECLDDPFVRQVCMLVARMGNPKVADFLAEFGEALKEQVFHALKRLNEAGIIARHQDRSFVQGPKWEIVSDDMRG